MKEGASTQTELHALLDSMAEKLPHSYYRISPTSFNPNDPQLRAFPRALEWQWRSCQTLLEAHKPKVVMMLAPFFWQIEPLLYHACQHAGAPIFVCQPDNLPVAGAAITNADVEAVVCPPSSAAAFSLFLLEKNIPFPKLWLTVHDAHAPSWELPVGLGQKPATVGQEVHLFPGVPLLAQCNALATARQEEFHLTEDYAWVSKEGVVTITSTEVDLVPLQHYTLPFSLQKTGGCACTKETFRRVS